MEAGEDTVLPRLNRCFGLGLSDVTEAPTWMVIKVMAYFADRGRFIDWTNHYLQRSGPTT